MGVQDCVDKILTFSDELEVGGQSFNKFPENDAEVALFWSEAWFEITKDLVKPPTVAPPEGSRALWESTMEALVAVPGGGIAAFDAAALAAFPLLAVSIAPNLIATPPTAPLLGLLTASLAPFIPTGTTDPVVAAEAFAGSLKDHIESALFTPPGPPDPKPFEVAP